MKTLHFDCFSGISGDMTLAALFDLGVDPEAIRQVYASFGLPISLEVKQVKRNGLAGTHINIVAPDQEDYRFLPDVERILNNSAMTISQRERAMAIFRKLAEAEAAVHGMPVEKVHFHEVGALDSIADIAGVAVAFDLLKIERFTCRSVPPGTGSVKCAHGLMPVPTPATALLLKNMPICSAPVTGELVTPTGAAILAACVDEFVEQPQMTIQKVGAGAGTRNPIEWPNILRVFLGDSQPYSTPNTVMVLETNLDDVSPEVIGYCSERLFEAGALDVFTTPIQMKKNRPATMLSIITPVNLVKQLESIIFRETGTLGIRRYPVERTTLQRTLQTVSTPYGEIHVKVGKRDDQCITYKPEYEECARLARELNKPIHEIMKLVNEQFNLTTAKSSQ